MVFVKTFDTSQTNVEQVCGYPKKNVKTIPNVKSDQNDPKTEV